MVALIDTLIDKSDTFELVRNQITAILVVEQANQQVLATAASKDPRLWTLRVFEERTNPWSEFSKAPADPIDVAPIVNVWFNREDFDKKKGDTVKRQQADGVFNIDCYGYGMSEGDGGAGHIAGDHAAALARDRCIRQVRNILMAAKYINLQLTDVGDRWPGSIETFLVPEDTESGQHVAAARLALQVSYNETSPQITGAAMETVEMTVKRAETGEVYLVAEYTP